MKNSNVFSFMEKCILGKLRLGKESTADLYRASSNRLKTFMHCSEMQWRELTPEIVDRFMIYLLNEGLAVNTVNSYISNLRSLYNKAVQENLVPRKVTHPFSHLHLRRQVTSKRALSHALIEKIADSHWDETPELKFSADLFLFSYLTCGMPFVDIAHLTQKNIHGNEIVYNRIKTGMQVRIGITPGIRKLLEYYTRPGAKWIFPILSQKEVVTHGEYKSMLRTHNDRLKRIGGILKIEQKLTSYVARHSWATVALQKDVSLTIISRALGHAEQRTTQIYLGEMDNEKVDRTLWKVIAPVDKLIMKITSPLFRK